MSETANTAIVEICDSAIKADFTYEAAFIPAIIAISATVAIAASFAHRDAAFDFISTPFPVDIVDFIHFGISATIALSTAFCGTDAALYRASGIQSAIIDATPVTAIMATSPVTPIIAMIVSAIAIAITVTAIIAIITRGKDRCKAAQYDSPGDNLARTNAVIAVAMVILRYGGGG
jgi:hypothetical protein